MGELGGVYSVWVGIGLPEGNSPLGRPGIGGRIILRRIFKKWDMGYKLDLAGSG
jgi:hypothetical protein